MRVLMEAAPPGTNTRKIADALESEVPGVMGVHCLHLWEISPGKAALMAHVHVQTQTRGEAGTENAGGGAGASAEPRHASAADEIRDQSHDAADDGDAGAGRVGGVRGGGKAACEVRQVRRAGGRGIKRLKPLLLTYVKLRNRKCN